MTKTALSCSLREAVDEVLETMFFVQGEGPVVPGRPAEELIAAQVEFEGTPPGTLCLRISRRAAHAMAADFLGEDLGELPPARTLEVISELANMICGSVLSRVESQTTFRLSTPSATLEVGDLAPSPSSGASVYQVELPGGALSLMLRVDGAGT